MIKFNQQQERRYESCGQLTGGGIENEDSELCGEEFFTELKNASKTDHEEYARKLFKDEQLICYGRISAVEAEMMGLDTY